MNDQFEEEIRIAKGELPPMNEIVEHFIEPFSAEVDEFTGKTVDIFDKFNQLEQSDSGTQDEPDPGTQSQPDGGFVPPLENFEPRPDEGFTPRSVDDIEDLSVETYTNFVLDETKRAVEHSLTQRRAREMDERVETSEATAKKIYPDYSAVVDNWTVPAIQADPRIFQWLRTLPNPGRTAYELGCQLRDQHTKQTGFRPTVRGRNSRVSQGSGITAAMIDRMTPAEFEREVLEPFKNSSGGE